MGRSTMVALASAWLVMAALAVVALTWAWAAAMHRLVWRPYAIGREFARQGVRGPTYRLFVGSNHEVTAMQAATAGDVLDRRSHDFIQRVMPHYKAWTAKYGKVYLSWTGHTPTLCVTDYDMVKQILSNRTGLFDKPDPGTNLMALFGKGLVFINGEDWVRHRCVVQPAFTMDKLKMMTKTMARCVGEMIQSWEARVRAAASTVQVEVGQQFIELTADVISHTAFGSSYMEGKEVFLAQRELQRIAFSNMNNVSIPGLEHIPTKTNVQRWQLEKKVRCTLMAIINERQSTAKEASSYGNDLLGLMLEANASADTSGQTAMGMDEIIDECKTFFFAGHGTTSHLLTWAVFLLGTHLDWQHKLREEVLHECGDTMALSKLKMMTMVMHETLRLYGAAIKIARTATASTELGRLKVPKGTLFMIPIAILQRDKEVWGADAGEFNPLRFHDGVGRAAKHPSALLSFSIGPRSCIGQDFAMLEAKTALAMILQRFEFEVSPEYVHMPAEFLTLQPRCGLPVMLKLLGQ